MKERDFNSAAKIFLGLSMVVTVITIINSIMSLRISKYTGTSTATIIAEIAVDFLILVAAVLTFQKKRYGLIGLVALFIIRVFISLPAAGNISASYVLGGNTAILLRDFGPFAIAMFFKKNGISGWKSMLASMKNEQDGDGPEITDEQNDLQNAPSNDGELSPTSTSKMVADIKVSEPMISDKSERAEFVETGTPTVNDTISSEDSVPQEHNRMSLKARLTSLPKSIKYGCIALTVLLIVFGIIAIVVSSKKYPEYISSFADKWKYSFNQPNNKLASSYFQKAMATRNPGDFYFDDGDESFWMRNSSYYSLESTYRERYKDVDVYAMKDTIKAKIEIDTTAKYIVRWHDSYQFGIGSGTVAMKRYDGWIEEDPEIVIIRVEKFDMNQAHEKEVEYMSYASLISTSNVDLTNQIANYYEADKNYNKSADIYSQALKFNKKSPFLLARLAYSQYLNGEASDAKINAEKALTIDPKETCALEVLCLLEADDFNWGEAKKWSKKAIDYGTTSSGPYYVYAEALYKQDEKKAAQEFYNRAYNLDDESPLTEKYKECAGCPFKVIGMQFAFHKQDGDTITDYGEKLFSSKSQYISTRASFEVLRCEDCTVQCKLYSKGKLSTGEDSKDGYTYTSDLYFGHVGENRQSVGSWGNSTPGNWPAGNYRFEIWYNGEMVGSESFVLY